MFYIGIEVSLITDSWELAPCAGISNLTFDGPSLVAVSATTLEIASLAEGVEIATRLSAFLLSDLYSENGTSFNINQY